MARQQSEPSAPGFCARWTLGIGVNIPQTGPGSLVCPPEEESSPVFQSGGEGLGEELGAGFDAAPAGRSTPERGGQGRGNRGGLTIAEPSLPAAAALESSHFGVVERTQPQV